MRRTPYLLALVASAAVPATAGAQAQAPDDATSPLVTGTTEAATAPALVASGFAVSPRAIVAGRTRARVMFRLDGGRGGARVRVDLVGAGGGRAVARLRAGRQPTGQVVIRRWRVDVPAGRYTARLRATDGSALRLASGSGRTTFPVTVKAGTTRRPTGAVPGASTVPKPKPKPAPTPSPAPAPAVTPAPAPAPAPVITGGRFPVRGAWSFGGADARFGAGRKGHIHQGQDVTAASGTPLISPGAGSVYWRRVQEGGAGHYLVIRSDAGPDWVFMHLLAGSETVAEGDRVAAGQQIAQVGSTGASTGPHLHFELWPDGWYAEGSKPVDPLPTLKAWAAVG